MPRRCINIPDIFSYICGELTFKVQRRNFKPLIKKCYQLYFGCKVGDQDKTWAPHHCCEICARRLTGWIKGERHIPFVVPMIWREPKDHSSDCYFCLTKTTGITFKSSHTVEYPDLPSAMRPVPHSDILPVPQPPENVIFSNDDSDRREQQSDDTNFEAGHKHIVNPSLIDSENIYLPPLHIKLGLMKNFVKAMDRNASGFAYLKQKCSSISDAKIKEGIFVEPQIRELLQDGNFQNSLNEVEAAAWNSFRNVFENFLGSVKALGCNMSLKIHFLHSHLDFFPDNLGAVSDEHGERFHQDYQAWRSGTKVNGVPAVPLRPNIWTQRLLEKSRNMYLWPNLLDFNDDLKYGGCFLSNETIFERSRFARAGMLHTTLVPIDLDSSGEFIFIRYHDFCNMGGERLTLQVEQTIRTLSKEGNSYSVIVKKLKAEGLDVGKATICRVVNGIGKKREAESNGQKFQVDRQRPVRTPATVSKVHKLTPFHMKNRATNARKLYEEHLAGSRSEYTATLDEAWMYVTYCNGIRKICYIKRGNQVPDNWVHQCSETFPKGFMVVGVMTGRGVLPLIKVPSKVKVNSEFYIECVLKPVIEQLKDLYPGEMDKVFLHHDKASSHTSNKTQQFLQEMKDTLGLNFIRNSDIPVKSPDASPLDFYGFGMLKQRLFNRRPKTEAGLWEAAQEEWSNVSLSKVKEVFAAWKVRCREIATKKGKHIEHMKKIHVRKIKF
ncbi:hypothetical protein LAZ67_6004025 [Cordylochernes scorpioides]|uniref:Transposase n=1 Tax=Cordylochernes scorpioides TaxID=51811 RepID=A0ABY6KL40_9ARAC|nr:hypothetical protein LAZ67_6004025 [Cordylochernes scorpioides]